MYDDTFWKLEEKTAVASAEIVLPSVLEATGAASVCDVGCGTGGWLRVAADHGKKIHGFDEYKGPLLIDEEMFTRCDIKAGIACDFFDLALCLEVGEHLFEESAAPLVDGLARARYVLFSAAIPGQGGIHHVNERWGTYWAELFAEHGYVGSSDIRWQFWDALDVADWYRQNILIFATPSFLERAGYRPGVIDVVHPQRMGNWP
jgi:SAM-dependent methyltransferase